MTKLSHTGDPQAQEPITEISGSQKFNSFQELKNSLMLPQLKQKLWAHLLVNNPGLIVELEQDDSLDTYLTSKIESILPFLRQLISEEKPDYIIEELCIQTMVADMRPYRFNYLWNLLDAEFSTIFKTWEQNGILTYELINLQQYCKFAFDALDFNMDNADDDDVYNTITGQIHQYLELQS